jgi:4-hydroxy-2-oxoheptanedioate aldolase
MIETLEAIGNIDELFAVGDRRIFHRAQRPVAKHGIRAGASFPPTPAASRHRQGGVRRGQDPRRRQDRWYAGDGDELPYWLEKGVQFFHVHSAPFRRLRLNGIKKSLGRVSMRSVCRS